MNEESEEKTNSEEKETSTTSSTSTTSTTRRPTKLNHQRRRRSANFPAPTGNKRCIDNFRNCPIFGPILGRSLIGGSPILGAANPSKAADEPTLIQRYETDSNVASVQTVPDDNEAVETVVQEKRSILKPGLSFLEKLSLPAAKTENLLHGNIPHSIESFEAVQKTSNDMADSSQSESVNVKQPAVSKASPTARHSVPDYNPDDFLPSFEYFPKSQPTYANYQPFKPSEPSEHSTPEKSHSNSHHDVMNSHHEDKNHVVAGPLPFVTNKFYDVQAPPLPDISHDHKHLLDHHVDKTPVINKGCRCDPEQFHELLQHMQSSYSQFHNGMMQLFDTFKSQSNCGGHGAADSSGSASYKAPDYEVLCADKNNFNADPSLHLKCQNALHESNVNPTSGYYSPPGSDIKHGGFENQFLPYSEFLKMMGNVNANSGTVLSDSHSIPDIKPVTSEPDHMGEITKKLKEHINQFEDVVTEPEEESQLNLLKAKMKSFLDKWNRAKTN